MTFRAIIDLGSDGADIVIIFRSVDAIMFGNLIVFFVFSIIFLIRYTVGL